LGAQSRERARIVDAAYRTLAANGGAALSMAELLDAAGLGTRAFYRHFAAKDELLLAVYRRDADRLAERLARAAAEGPPTAALTAFVETLLHVADDPRRRRRLRIMSAEAVRQARGYAGETQRFRAALEASLAEILARGRGDGSFPLTDPAPDARSIRAALGQAFDDQVAGIATVRAAEAARQVTDFALRATGATGATDRAAAAAQ
jgi:AcrR family transcriptional regulator